MPELYTIFAPQKNNKMLEFYITTARKIKKMHEFYMIFAKKCFPAFFFWGGGFKSFNSFCPLVAYAYDSVAYLDM